METRGSSTLQIVLFEKTEEVNIRDIKFRLIEKEKREKERLIERKNINIKIRHEKVILKNWRLA